MQLDGLPSLLQNIRERAWRNDGLRSAYASTKAAGLIGAYVVGGASVPVLVYQMGSVGSRSLYYSLKRFYSGFTHHTHSLLRKWRSAREEPVYQFCVQGPVPVRVISLVRDPIAHNLSRFFQGFEQHTGVPYREHSWSIDELRTKFLDTFDHDTPLRWFEEWENTLGLDVYGYPLSDDGISWFEKERIRGLVLRTELPDEKKERAVRELLGLDHFEIERANTGSEKPYAEEYARFKKEFVAPDWYVDKMYENKFFRHFYTPDHRRQFEERWTSRSDE